MFGNKLFCKVEVVSCAVTDHIIKDNRLSVRRCLAEADVSLDDSSVKSDAINFNTAPIAVKGSISLPEVPQICSDNVYCSSVKKAEKENALIMRLVEYRGKNGSVEITVPQWAKTVCRVNLLERQEENIEIKNGKAEITVRSYEILTLRFTR